jgi:hypothetical protein
MLAALAALAAFLGIEDRQVPQHRFPGGLGGLGGLLPTHGEELPSGKAVAFPPFRRLSRARRSFFPLDDEAGLSRLSSSRSCAYYRLRSSHPSGRALPLPDDLYPSKPNR